MKIAFDLDRVFVNTPPFIPNAAIDAIYKKKNHKVIYRIPGRPEQFLRIFLHFPLFRPPMKDSIKTLSEIAQEKKHDIFLISGRFGFLDKRTAAWLKKYKLSSHFKQVYINLKNNQPHIFKNKLIQDLGIEAFIDDDLDTLLYLAQNNPTKKFYWLVQSHAGISLPSNITIIKTMAELKNKYL